jgi:hypothetical protein
MTRPIDREAALKMKRAQPAPPQRYQKRAFTNFVKYDDARLVFDALVAQERTGPMKRYRIRRRAKGFDVVIYELKPIPKKDQQDV